jgi:excisionase family DNA binding protein
VKDIFSMVKKTTDGNKPQPEFISRAAAARALRVTPFTVDRLIRSQRLPFFKVPGHNRLWIDRAAVEQLATAAGMIGGQP